MPIVSLYMTISQSHWICEQANLHYGASYWTVKTGIKNRHCPNEWTDLRSGYQHWTGINALDRLSALASNVNEPQGASNVKVSAVAVEIAVGWWLRNCESKRNGEHCCVSNRLVYTVYCNLTVSRAKPTTTSYLYDNSVNYYRFA